MWRRSLAAWLALGLSLAPCSAWSEPQVSPSGVSLSIAEYDEIVAAIEEADRQIKASSETIARQVSASRRLSILCAALALALVTDGVADIVRAVKE